MATSRIKGITIEIGGDTTGLDKALKGVNQEIRTTSSSLKDVERLLKMDPGNTELLRQKYELLNRSINTTEQKLEALKDAERQVQEQMRRGEASEDQYNALRREIIATEAGLRNLREQSERTERAINGIDEEPVEEVAEAAENAKEELQDAGREAADFGDLLKAEAIVEGAKAIVSSLKDITEETKEYQKIMGSLEVSSEKSGYTAEETARVYKKLYGVLGDDQTAATAAANLQALGLEQEKLLELTDSAIGAWAQYGDSIPIDGLAESINETIKAGQVTGTLADVLNWASLEGETFGVAMKEATEENKDWNKAVEEAATAEDLFNLALQEAGDSTERTNMVMKMLAGQGLEEAGKAWRENNKTLVESNEAQAAMQENMAEIGDRVGPIFTEIETGLGRVLEKVLEITEGIDTEQIGEEIANAFDYFISDVIPKIVDFINFLIENKEIVISILAGISGGLIGLKLAAFAGEIQAVISGTTALASAFPLLGGAIALLTNPIFWIATAVVGLVALIAQKGDEIQGYLQKLDDFLQGVFAKDWTEVFGPILGSALNKFFANAKNTWNLIKIVLNGVIDFIRGVFTGDWERAWNGVIQIFQGIFTYIGNIAKRPINSVIGMVNGAISGINTLIRGINNLPGVDIPTIGKIPYLAKGGVLSSGSAIVGEAGPEILTMSGNRAIVQPLTNQTTNNTSLGEITLNIYGAPGQDVRELADIIENEIADRIERREAAFA